MNWETVKRNGGVILATLLLIINLLVPYIKPKITVISIELVNIIVTATYLIIELIEKMNSNNKMKEISCGIDEIKEDTHKLASLNEIIQKQDAEIEKYKETKEKQYEDSKLLSRLINENLISINTVENQIPDKKFISVLCYQEGLVKPEKLNIKRMYPEIFEKMGFVRLAGTWGYFIIAEDNIYPKKFRNIDNLANYLLYKGKFSIEKEWTEILEMSKKDHHRFYNNRKEQPNPLNFNMLIAKTNMRDMRHKFLKRNYFNERFSSELVSITNINKLRISDTEKLRIKNFVLQSSMNVLVLGLSDMDKGKLLSLEDTFKKPVIEGGLAITNFCDYHKKNKEELVKILINKFSEETAEKYANLLIMHSQKYESLFMELGVQL